MDLPPSNSNESIFERNFHSFSFILKSKFKHTLALFLLLSSSAVILIILGSFEIEPETVFRFSLWPQILPNNKKPLAGVCDYSYGRWVRDDYYRLQSYNENCPFLDPGFRCRQNGREDGEYLKWRWQPHGCDLPRYLMHGYGMHAHLYFNPHVSSFCHGLDRDIIEK